MLRETRLRAIMQSISETGSVKTVDLCKSLQVSDMTIRRDLDTLAERNKIIRTYGGAVLPEESSMELLSDQEKRKISIAKRALEFLDGKQSVFLDSGSTVRTFARFIPIDSRYTVVTNNLFVASEIDEHPYLTVNVIGGELHKKYHSCYGSLAEEQIRKYRVDVAFLGAGSIGDDGFLYDNITAEAGVKKNIIQASNETYVLIDSSKLNRFGLIAYSHVCDVTAVITDKFVDPDLYHSLTDMGANLLIADYS